MPRPHGRHCRRCMARIPRNARVCRLCGAVNVKTLDIAAGALLLALGAAAAWLWL